MRHAAVRPVAARDHARLDRPSARATALAPVVLLPVLGLLGLAVATGVALVVLGVVDPLARPSTGAAAAPHPTAAPAAPPAGPGPDRGASPRESRAGSVLGQWDRSRAAAWAAGDADRLRALYVPGSVAAQRDVAMLERWSARGLRVRHLRMRAAGLEVLAAGPRRWRLRVSDRLTGAYAVVAEPTVPGDERRVRLPRDEPTTRVIDLRRADDGWLVASVTRAG